MRRRFLIVHNPIAGRHGRTLTRHVVEELERRGAAVGELAMGRPLSDADRRRLVEDCDAVIAAGGDGTVRRLASYLEGCPLPIGLVPVGTGNVLAEEMGLVRAPRALADVLLDGPSIDIVGARANGEHFFLMAGVGFDGAVIRLLDLAWKRRLGKLAYVVPVLRALADVPPLLAVDLDGARHHANWVVLTNARRYGGKFVIADAADLRQPGLLAILVTARDRASLVRQLLRLAAGRLGQDGDVRTIAFRRAEVMALPPVPVQVDGDDFGTTPLVVEAGGSALSLIVPPAYLPAARH